MKYDEFYNREMKRILQMQTKTVRKASVINTQDEQKNYRPRAFIALQDDVLPSENLKKELGKYVIEEMTKRHRISRYLYPNWIEFVDELPKSGDGSTEYYKVQKKFKNWSNFFQMERDGD
jgi:acyl-coenzyme A synthetase/AMP-(fatty) acid ligase